jgi:hypothetical protein
MPDTIKDGTGQGYVAKVDFENRLHVNSVQETAFHHNAEGDEGYFASSLLCPVTVAGGRMFRMLADEYHLHVYAISMSWNGGNTNHNRMVQVDVYKGDPLPSANYVDVTPKNPIFGRPRTPEATMQSWNGVGDGMTVAAGGELQASFLIGPGTTFLPVEGMFMAAKTAAFSVNAKGEEAGNFIFTVMGYIEEL